MGRLLPEADRVVITAVARNAELAPGQKISVLLEKLAGQHIAVLLDNLETVQVRGSGQLVEPGLQQLLEIEPRAEQRTHLYPHQPGTARPAPRGLRTWEHVISLEDGLPLAEAVALLRRFDPSGAAGLRDAPDAELAELGALLGGFPRTLESVAGMLLEDPLLSLHDVRQRVDLLQGEVSAAVVEQALAHLSDEAMTILGALSVFGRPATYEALLHLASPPMDEPALRRVLGRLVQASFVKANREPPVRAAPN